MKRYAVLATHGDVRVGIFDLGGDEGRYVDLPNADAIEVARLVMFDHTQDLDRTRALAERFAAECIEPLWQRPSRAGVLSADAISKWLAEQDAAVSAN